MKKTFVTNMPDHIGAFLKASRCFSNLGVNITRVSYNRAVDLHTLFIEVDGAKEQIALASEQLKDIGYLQGGDNAEIILIEFQLRDIPGSVTAVLELISQFNFNISYISSQENGTDFQHFKMGLYVDNLSNLTQFLVDAEKICKVKVIKYNQSEKVFDNSIFYNAYVNGLVSVMGLSENDREKLLVNVNLAMQTLDEQGLSPYKTFDSISKFTELLAECKGERFKPRITKHCISPSTTITLIEPDCGSNTAIIESCGERVFIDSGYACYREEMLKLFNQLLPDFKSKKEKLIITHADVDHCGLMGEFDEIISGQRTIECLIAESEKRNGFREDNYLHKPYVNICKLITGYKVANKKSLTALWNKSSLSEPIEQIGFFKIGELKFEVYEGQGGHLLGEIILIDFEHKIAFTGDVFVNLKDLTAKQAEYNKYAPILMTSVDTDSKLCATERSAVLQRLGVGQWNIFGGHGQKKDYQTKSL